MCRFPWSSIPTEEELEELFRDLIGGPDDVQTQEEDDQGRAPHDRALRDPLPLHPPPGDSLDRIER